MIHALGKWTLLQKQVKLINYTSQGCLAGSPSQPKDGNLLDLASEAQWSIQWAIQTETVLGFQTQANPAQYSIRQQQKCTRGAFVASDACESA